MLKWFLARPVHQLLIAFALIILGVFFRLTWHLHSNGMTNDFDVQVMTLMMDVRNDAMNGIAVDVTALGSATLISFFSVFSVLFFLMVKDKLAAQQMATSSIGAAIATKLMKNFIARPRPVEIPKLVAVSGFSYPSGHSLISAAFYLSMAFLLSRHVETSSKRSVLFCISLLVIVSIATSRVYLGAHYPTDTLSGVLLGSAWSLLVSSFFTKLSKASTLERIT